MKCHDHNTNNIAQQKGDVTSLPPLQESRPEIPEGEERRNTGFDCLLEPYGSLLEEVER